MLGAHFLESREVAELSFSLCSEAAGGHSGLAEYARLLPPKYVTLLLHIVLYLVWFDYRNALMYFNYPSYQKDIPGTYAGYPDGMFGYPTMVLNMFRDIIWTSQ